MKRSPTPSMRYLDSDGQPRTLTYVQGVSLAGIASMWGNGWHCSQVSIHTRTVWALMEGGLIHVNGHFGDWTIKGITKHGKKVLEAWEKMREQAGG